MPGMTQQYEKNQGILFYFFSPAITRSLILSFITHIINFFEIIAQVANIRAAISAIFDSKAIISSADQKKFNCSSRSRH
jgi:hypothetical protein